MEGSERERKEGKVEKGRKVCKVCWYYKVGKEEGRKIHNYLILTEYEGRKEGRKDAHLHKTS